MFSDGYEAIHDETSPVKFRSVREKKPVSTQCIEIGIAIFCPASFMLFTMNLREFMQGKEDSHQLGVMIYMSIYLLIIQPIAIWYIRKDWLPVLIATHTLLFSIYSIAFMKSGWIVVAWLMILYTVVILSVGVYVIRRHKIELVIDSDEV